MAGNSPRVTRSSGKQSHPAQRRPPCGHSALGGTPDSSKPHEKAAFHMVPPRPELPQHRRNDPDPAGCTMLAGIRSSEKKQASSGLGPKSLLLMRAPDSMLASSPTNPEAQQPGLVGGGRSASDAPAGTSPVPRSQEGPRVDTGHVLCPPVAPGLPLRPSDPFQGRRAAGWGPDEKGALESFSQLSQELGGRQDGAKRGNRCTRDPLSCLMCPIVPNSSGPL